ESIDLIIDLIETHFKHKIRGVFHCFTGNQEQAERIIQLNMYLGIGGVLTFKNSNLRNVLADINPECLLIETDAPYLAPVPYRGKRNEPAYIELVLNELCKIYQRSRDNLALLIEEN